VTVEKLSRKLWEFGEQIRLHGFIGIKGERAANPRRPRA
jgi:hypothetical protein